MIIADHASVLPQTLLSVSISADPCRKQRSGHSSCTVKNGVLEYTQGWFLVKFFLLSFDHYNSVRTICVMLLGQWPN